MREACFSRCDGVAAWETSEPCVDGSLALCLGYALVDPKARAACPVEPSDPDDGGFAFELLGSILDLAFQAATSAALGEGDDEDDEEEEWEEPRTRDPVPGTSKASRLPSSSSAAPRSEWSTKPSDGASPASKFGSSSKLRRDD